MGFIGISGTSFGIRGCTFPHSTREQALLALGAGLCRDVVEDESAFGELPDLFARYFAGQRVDFSGVRVDISGLGAFYRRALDALRRVPYGTTITYAELADMAGSPGAARAVGNAMARNPVPIVIPCHRVVAAGGRIGGFSAGLEWKRKLLRLEGV